MSAFTESTRTGSFSDALVLMLSADWSTAAEADEDSPFTLTAGDDGRWALAGEVDFASAPALESALAATAATPWVVDVAGLDFIDVAGMRAIARSAAGSPVPLELQRVSERLDRLWRLSGFDRAAPGVRLVG